LSGRWATPGIPEFGYDQASDPGFTLWIYMHLVDEGLGSADFLDVQVLATHAEAVSSL